MNPDQRPLFPVTTVGSWPRTPEILATLHQRGPQFNALKEAAVLRCLRLQEDIGVDIVTDGELGRDNFYSFVATKMAGIEMMTMADLLDHVEDKAGFEEILNALDVPAFAIRNPTVVGSLKLTEPLVAGDVEFLRRHTDRPIKATLPGPYLLSRSMWVKSLSEGAYPTRLHLAHDIVRLLRDEIIRVREAGASIIQLDEPVLTELVFAGKSSTRTFMCAALAASASPEEELDFAVSLINQVVTGVEGIETAVHICRGNWSQDESVLLQGSYDALIPYLNRINADQFVLEFATSRAGDPAVLGQLTRKPRIGFGIVNPRVPEVEDPPSLVKKVEYLARHVKPGNILVNPDCGFGTFSQRPVSDEKTAVAKLRSLVEASRVLRTVFKSSAGS